MKRSKVLSQLENMKELFNDYDCMSEHYGYVLNEILKQDAPDRLQDLYEYSDEYLHRRLQDKDLREEIIERIALDPTYYERQMINYYVGHYSIASVEFGEQEVQIDNVDGLNNKTLEILGDKVDMYHSDSTWGRDLFYYNMSGYGVYYKLDPEDCRKLIDEIDEEGE